MTFLNTFCHAFPKKLASACGRLVYYFSLYAVPAGIVLFSIAALLMLNNRYPPTSGSPLQLQVFPDPGFAHSPGTALEALKRREHVTHAKVDGPTWFLVDVPAEPELGETAIDVPSRLTQRIACWNAATMRSLGAADQDLTTGSLRTSKQGYSVMLGRSPLPASILCFATFVDQTTLNVDLWSITDLRTSTSRFDRGVSLLEGGLLTIALFILVIAITNREWIYLLLAAWLVGNLRLGALAMGWDTQWLGRNIPLEWMPFIRQVTVAAYYLLTYTLFTQLFRSSRVASYPRLLRITQWAGLLQLAAAFLLPYEQFRPLMWAVCGFGILVMAFLLARTVYRTRSRVWMWHIVSLSMALCVMLSGILLVIFGRTPFVDIFNSVVALLLSNVMIALAVAERMREDRRERIRAQTELVSNYAVTPIGMFTLGFDNVFQRANPVLEQMLGVSLNNDNDTAIHWTDYFEEQDWHKLSEQTEAGQEVEIKRLDPSNDPGLPQHFVVRAAMADGRIEGSLQDITARTKTINQLRLLADNDPLTDVLNRRGIEKALDKSLGDLKEGQPCALAYLDLDHFKRINGLFGHTAGDEVLKQVCQRIKSALSDSQHIGRIGGDEFIVLFPNTPVSEAREAAKRIIEQLSTTAFHIGTRAFQIKSAIGVVEVNQSMSAKDAISAANHACREARKQHQSVVVYEQDSQELLDHTEELRLFDQLEGGDSPRGLYLELQPIMSLKDPLQSLNFEVLLRVRDSAGALIPSGKIVSSAEESGTITIIDKWVFSATLEWLAKHEKRLGKTQFISINLSGVSLNDDKFIDAFFANLAHHSHLTKRLCVEITEGVALQDLDRTRQFMKRLQRMGVRIALDDFGAGYTSFSYLKELRADAIKIDGALIKDMLANDTNIAIVRTIVELARNLGMKSIAEWVEDGATMQALQDMGVDYVQGYIVSKSRPPIDILNALTITDLVSSSETLAFIRKTAAQARLEP
ncbi:putative bifunctional diguanylate cyclase/phosphodiesterase [Pollutimonas sp. M17]|uniref:putative bifunctional diguanylate cyclase/phosphodiesterase n=1 Tax=Pollutimonas sp. M17 TaxID=2962065 RepID=UPI0021F4572A|nr:EAL domain-containing protein [Pollutimonas sp. M17]UYO93661.1 EAL domain-containing protein [Pollutimonas sp. M17]